jgi:hypothetical protein
VSYDIERKAITNFINSQSYFGLSPFGLDGAPVVLTDDSGFMTILNGQALQASLGSPGANRHDYVGVLSITVLTPGNTGASGATGFIDTIIAAFTGRKLDEDGNAPSAGSTVIIDFGRDGLVPHVSSKRQEAPYLRTVINAPFVRTERK